MAIAGTTRSPSMPGIPETVESNGAEAFAARLAPDGRSVVWMTLLGGSGSDEGRALVLDRSGSAWIAGRTTSPDLASGATVGAGSPAGGHDLFVARLEADGATRWISRLGGDGNDDPRSIALDSRGDVYVAGVAESASGREAMAAKLSPDGAVIAFLRFGGGGDDEAWAIALDRTDMLMLFAATAMMMTITTKENNWLTRRIASVRATNPS